MARRQGTQGTLTAETVQEAKALVEGAQECYRELSQEYGAERVTKEIGYQPYWGGYENDLDGDVQATWGECRQQAAFLAKVVGATGATFSKVEHATISAIEQALAENLRLIARYIGVDDSVESARKNAQAWHVKASAFKRARAEEKATREDERETMDVPTLVGSTMAERYGQ